MQNVQVNPSTELQDQQPNVIIPDSLRQQLITVIAEKIKRCSQDVKSLVNNQNDMMSSDRRYRNDCGVNTSDQERSYLLTSRENKQLTRLLDAKQRALTDPWFGICKKCQEPIPVERLIEVPNTSWCTTCKNEHNNGG